MLAMTDDQFWDRSDPFRTITMKTMKYTTKFKSTYVSVQTNRQYVYIKHVSMNTSSARRKSL